MAQNAAKNNYIYIYIFFSTILWFSISFCYLTILTTLHATCHVIIWFSLTHISLKHGELVWSLILYVQILCIPLYEIEWHGVNCLALQKVKNEV